VSRLLFFGLPVSGHTSQALAVSKELLERGEQVIYYSAGALADDLRGAGLPCRLYRSVVLERLPSAPFTANWPELWMRATEDVLAEEQQRVRADNPDCILYDGLAVWGRCLSRLLGVPAVASISTLAFDARLMQEAAEFADAPAEAGSSRVRGTSVADRFAYLGALARAEEARERIARTYGVAMPAPGFSGVFFEASEALNIVYTSRLFQPSAESFDSRFQFVGRAVFDMRRPMDPGWSEIAHPSLVYVSLGTIFNRDRDFFRMCFDALSEIDCQAVVSTGRGLTPEELGEPPPNVIVRSYVPQFELLERCAACITNGGLNTVSDSLYHGVPIVAVPSHAEQSLQSLRVERLGAGVCLRRTSLTRRALRDAVRRLLGGARARYRQRSRRIGDSLRAGGGAKRAADCVQDFVRARGAPLRTGSGG
jgi:MGT family glycosyltransferase